jgi:hypothetical protein
VRNGILSLLGGVFVAMLAASGCGGGGGNDTTVTESSIRKPQYVAKATAICESGTKKIETDFGVFLKEKEGVTQPSAADYVELYEKVVAANVPDEVEELRELGAPKGDAKEVEAMLKAREESVAIAKEDPEAIVKDSKKVFGKASALAKSYGLKACGTR